MPYSTAEELPESVKRNIPSAGGKRMFMEVVNSQLEAGKSESVAFASAWASLKENGYEENDQGRWVKKQLPTTSQIHVDAPIGSESRRRRRRRRKEEEEKTEKASVKVGDMVSWKSSGGTARGKVKQIITDGDVPNISGDVTVTGTEDEPAAQIVIVDDDGKETDTIVGHKVSTLNKAKTFNAPESARNNAKKVLRWREEHGDEVKGMTRVGWERANQLANNENLSLDTVKRMSQFARHEKNSKVADEFKSEPWKDRGYVAWLGWGGTSGINWAKSVVEQETNKQADMFTVDKRELDDDQFTMPAEAVARSYDLGLDGKIHVHQDADGQALYMPGDSHDNYLQRIRDIGNVPNTAALSGATGEGGILAALGNLFQQLAGGVMKSEPAESESRVSKREEFSEESSILKVDEEQRIVWGWASVITEKGEPYADSEGDVILPDEMMKATTEFMLDARVAKAMHEGEQVGDVVHSFPLTYELAKLFDIETEREGWIIAQKINDDETWERVKSGELSAFSIGGSAIRDEIE